MSVNPFRLPRHTVPHHYDIRLELDLETFTFSGSVGADIEVLETTDDLVLNSAEVEIKSASVDGTAVESISYDEEMERATLTLSSPLDPGEHRLEIEHVGRINDQLRGLYQAFYVDKDGESHPIATSQCQSTDARRRGRGPRGLQQHLRTGPDRTR